MNGKTCIIIFILFFIGIIALTKFIQQDTLEVSAFPNNTDGILIITVDDLSMQEPYEKKVAEYIIRYFRSVESPATFFAIPAKMSEYLFPPEFEVAQHGYDHENPLDGTSKEFVGLNASEVEWRLRLGKAMLESLGFRVYGHRAPCWSLSKDYIPLLSNHYMYDSSFQNNASVDSDLFILPPIWPDPLEGVCEKGSCDMEKCDNRRKLILPEIRNRSQSGEPAIIVSHFWDLEKALEDDEGIKCLNKFFREVNKQKLWKTTMIGYVRWQKKLDEVTIMETANSTHYSIKINECVKGLTLRITTPKKIILNCETECMHAEDRITCIVDETPGHRAS